MQTENDPKLKLAMARLLPERISVCFKDGNDKRYPGYRWCDKVPGHFLWIETQSEILETEWLYVMHLVEQTLESCEGLDYLMKLRDQLNTKAGSFRMTTATFNQRATAMCHVKGIDINTI